MNDQLKIFLLYLLLCIGEPTFAIRFQSGNNNQVAITNGCTPNDNICEFTCEQNFKAHPRDKTKTDYRYGIINAIEIDPNEKYRYYCNPTCKIPVISPTHDKIHSVTVNNDEIYQIINLKCKSMYIPNTMVKSSISLDTFTTLDIKCLSDGWNNPIECVDICKEEKPTLVNGDYTNCSSSVVDAILSVCFTCHKNYYPYSGIKSPKRKRGKITCRKGRWQNQPRCLTFDEYKEVLGVKLIEDGKGDETTNISNTIKQTTQISGKHYSLINIWIFFGVLAIIMAM